MFLYYIKTYKKKILIGFCIFKRKTMALYSDFKSVGYFDEDVKAINNAIRNILLTSIGSLPGQPEFGSRLNELIFEQIDHITIKMLKQLIQEALYKWETRIQVLNIEIQEVPEYNKLIASIDYMFTDSELNKTGHVSLNLLPN